MKLRYRGVEYDYTPPSLEVSESEILGRYRGRSLRFSYVKHVPFPQPEADLSFRGATYHTNNYGQVKPVVPAQEVPQGSKFMPVFDSMATARRHLLQESARIHQESIRRSLQRRIEIAQAQGDDMLVRQLEDEMHQIA
ncbi:MAG: DUF4278 domain-containing protein [Leptolyngbya sp. SIO1E4]|nr:DUF4278 domain-containing protein [Leptolyngbya sp. SIO1E4]